MEKNPQIIFKRSHLIQHASFRHFRCIEAYKETSSAQHGVTLFRRRWRWFEKKSENKREIIKKKKHGPIWVKHVLLGLWDHMVWVLKEANEGHIQSPPTWLDHRLDLLFPSELPLILGVTDSTKCWKRSSEFLVQIDMVILPCHGKCLPCRSYTYQRTLVGPGEAP